MPVIYEYDNYRTFLKDYYEARKAADKKFSFRYFSRLAGFNSSSVLSNVIEGKRNIAPYSIENFAKALKLNKEETEFFRNLVMFNQAKTTEEKQTYAQRLMKNRVYKKLHPLSASQYNYAARWYCVPIRELVNLQHFREDPQWIAEQMRPPITPKEAGDALEELLKLGLIERDGEGRLRQTNTNVSSGDEVTSVAIAKFHREMFKRASEAIDTFPRNERDISCITVGLTPETIKVIKEKIQKFRKELLETATTSQKPTSVHHISFQFFPLTEMNLEEKE